MYTEHLGWGLEMTVLGMGLVFALLALLWLLLTIVLKLDKEEDEPAEEAARESTAETERPATAAAGEPGEPLPARATVNGMEADLVAAILVAAHQHRQTLRRQAAPPVRAVWPGSRLFASRWLASGRARQINDWQPGGR
ncbi:MAG: OadG family protein [Candidatus Accumulibacter sp.]|jgi:sodium pump decarboxylase gamma subunit|nr:OadG family protein [Accumulibacter sp.]